MFKVNITDANIRTDLLNLFCKYWNEEKNDIHYLIISLNKSLLNYPIKQNVTWLSH